jgi:hypothetical protein
VLCRTSLRMSLTACCCPSIRLVVFPQVCELDIIFNFHKAYYILDELVIGGFQQESSKKEILRICTQQEDYMDESKEEGFTRPRTGTR